MNHEAAAIVETLELEPHPEGGWFRETWRAESVAGGRAAGTAIYFLLGAEERSHWHRVDAAELWLWHRGDPIELAIAADEKARVNRTILGPAVDESQRPQCLISAGAWQAARPVLGESGYALVSCVVVPGFEFDGFELASPDWKPERA